jgi:hypothetical protein
MVEACDVIRQWCFENDCPTPLPPEGMKRLPGYVDIGLKHTHNIVLKLDGDKASYIKNATGTAGLPTRVHLGSISDPDFFSKLHTVLVEEKVLPFYHSMKAVSSEMTPNRLIRLWCEQKGLRAYVCFRGFITVSRPGTKSGITIRFYDGWGRPNVTYNDPHWQGLTSGDDPSFPPWPAFKDISDPEFFPALGKLLEELYE